MKSEWKTEILEHVCQLITDGAHNSPKSVESGEYMASVKDFTDYGLDFSKCKLISENDYNLLKKQGCVPEINDILVGKDGARFFEDIIISWDLWALKPKYVFLTDYTGYNYRQNANSITATQKNYQPIYHFLKSQIKHAINRYKSTHGIIISKTTTNIVKKDNIIYLPPEIFAFM